MTRRRVMNVSLYACTHFAPPSEMQESRPRGGLPAPTPEAPGGSGFLGEERRGGGPAKPRLLPAACKRYKHRRQSYTGSPAGRARVVPGLPGGGLGQGPRPGGGLGSGAGAAQPRSRSTESRERMRLAAGARPKTFFHTPAGSLPSTSRFEWTSFGPRYEPSL